MLFQKILPYRENPLLVSGVKIFLDEKFIDFRKSFYIFNFNRTFEKYNQFISLEKFYFKISNPLVLKVGFYGFKKIHQL